MYARVCIREYVLPPGSMRCATRSQTIINEQSLAISAGVLHTRICSTVCANGLVVANVWCSTYAGVPAAQAQLTCVNLLCCGTALTSYTFYLQSQAVETSTIVLQVCDHRARQS